MISTVNGVDDDDDDTNTADYSCEVNGDIDGTAICVHSVDDGGIDATIGGRVDAAVTDTGMDTVEEDGERFSTDSVSSSAEDDSGECRSRCPTIRGKTDDEQDDGGGAKNRTTTTTTTKHNGCPAEADTTTSPPPDVIMHHNNAMKRKGSRRGRRRRRSPYTGTVAAVAAVVEDQSTTQVVDEESQTSETVATKRDVAQTNRVDHDDTADAVSNAMQDTADRGDQLSSRQSQQVCMIFIVFFFFLNN